MLERTIVSRDAAPEDGLTRRRLLGSATASCAAMTAAALGGMPAAWAEAAPDYGFGAPLAEIHVPPGVLTLEQKSAMIKGVTDVLIRATDLPPARHPHLWVQIIETASGGWGVGGQVFVPRSGQKD